MKMRIPLSAPDITEEEIAAVTAVLSIRLFAPALHVLPIVYVHRSAPAIEKNLSQQLDIVMNASFERGLALMFTIPCFIYS